MSLQTNPVTKSFEAASGLSTKQYYIVKDVANSSSPYGISLASATTDKLLGILQNEPKSNEAANVAIGGTSKVVIGGYTVAAGNWLTADSSGKASPTTQNKDVVIGQALESGSADGDVIEVLITHFTLSA